MKTSIVNSSSAAGAIRIVALAVLLGFVPFVLDSQAQESPAPAEQATSEQPAGFHTLHSKHKDKTFMEVLREGGIVMIPLAAFPPACLR